MAHQATPVESADRPPVLDFVVTCPDCQCLDGAHAYWCPVRKRYAKDRQQGS